MHALGHLRVIDLSESIAGAYCTKLLAGFGAEVIKIETPDRGDALRRLGPFAAGDDHEASIPHLWLNTAKKSVALDLGQDRDRVRQLIRDADLVIESGRPGAMEALGLGFDALRTDHPRLVMTSVTPFGQDGPYRDYEAEEMQLNALSGGMYLTGHPSQPPLNPGVENCQYTAGLCAYVGSLLALFHAHAAGVGQHVDISMQECGVDNVELALINHLHKGATPKRGKHPMVPWDLYATADGWACITCAPFRNWKEVRPWFGEPKLLEERFLHIRDRLEHRDETEALMAPVLQSKTRAEVFAAGQRTKMAWGYLAEFGEVVASPQLQDRKFFVATEHPSAGTLQYCGAPFALSATPWRQERAPLLGEHTESVLAAAEQPPRPRNAATNGASERAQALEGIRILDLSHSWAAPHGTRVLADFGAEVLRIEYPARLCMLRGGTMRDETYNRHPMWHQVNRNKMSVTLDFADPAQLEAFHALVAEADVVVTNSRTDVAQKYGITYEQLREWRPDLIVVSMAAYGATGPHRDVGAYGGVLEAMGGIQNLTGYGPGEKPMRIKEVDITNGLVGACAVLTALMARQRDGRGQWADVSQLEGAMHSLIGEHLLEYAATGQRQPARGNRHRIHAPQGCYRCDGDDRWLALTIRNDDEWVTLCDALSRPDLGQDPRYRTAAQRAEQHDALDALIEAETQKRRAAEWMTDLQQVGLAAAAVLDMADVAADRHLQARGFFVTPQDGSEGVFPGVPIRLSRTPGAVRWPGPPLGAHNSYAIGTLAGREDAIRAIDEDALGSAFDP
ncbi:MAG: CoA transferase [Planctomycetota bacterium]